MLQTPVVDLLLTVLLSQMLGEKVVIPCHDSVVSSLTLVVGMIVMTVNVDAEDGLTNGATGVVKHTDYRIEGTNRPSIIWVLFDDPRVGRSAREKYRTLYNSSIHREWTPVFDVQRTFITNYKTYQNPVSIDTSFR